MWLVTFVIALPLFAFMVLTMLLIGPLIWVLRILRTIFSFTGTLLLHAIVGRLVDSPTNLLEESIMWFPLVIKNAFVTFWQSVRPRRTGEDEPDSAFEPFEKSNDISWFEFAVYWVFRNVLPAAAIWASIFLLFVWIGLISKDFYESLPALTVITSWLIFWSAVGLLVLIGRSFVLNLINTALLFITSVLWIPIGFLFWMPAIASGVSRYSFAIFVAMFGGKSRGHEGDYIRSGVEYFFRGWSVIARAVEKKKRERRPLIPFISSFGHYLSNLPVLSLLIRADDNTDKLDNDELTEPESILKPLTARLLSLLIYPVLFFVWYFTLVATGQPPNLTLWTQRLISTFASSSIEPIVLDGGIDGPQTSASSEPNTHLETTIGLSAGLDNSVLDEAETHERGARTRNGLLCVYSGALLAEECISPSHEETVSTRNERRMTARTRFYLRSGPGVEYPIVYWVSRGEPVVVVGQLEGSDWVQIEHNITPGRRTATLRSVYISEYVREYYTDPREARVFGPRNQVYDPPAVRDPVASVPVTRPDTSTAMPPEPEVARTERPNLDGQDTVAPNVYASPTTSDMEMIDREDRPILRVQPEYPRRALERGVEGSVCVEFSVTTAGAVRDPVVVSSDSNLLNRPSLHAIVGFRYPPQTGNDKLIPRHGMRYCFDFVIRDEPR